MEVTSLTKQRTMQVGEVEGEGANDIFEDKLLQINTNDIHSAIVKVSEEEQNVLENNIITHNSAIIDDKKEGTLAWSQIAGKNIDDINSHYVSGFEKIQVTAVKQENLLQSEQSSVLDDRNAQTIGVKEETQSCNTEGISDSDDQRDQSSQTCKHPSIVMSTYFRSNLNLVNDYSSKEKIINSNYKLVDTYSVCEEEDISEISTVKTFLKNQEKGRVNMMRRGRLSAGAYLKSQLIKENNGSFMLPRRTENFEDTIAMKKNEGDIVETISRSSYSTNVSATKHSHTISCSEAYLMTSSRENMGNCRSEPHNQILLQQRRNSKDNLYFTSPRVGVDTIHLESCDNKSESHSSSPCTGINALQTSGNSSNSGQQMDNAYSTSACVGFEAILSEGSVSSRKIRIVPKSGVHSNSLYTDIDSFESLDSAFSPVQSMDSLFSPESLESMQYLTKESNGSVNSLIKSASKTIKSAESKTWPNILPPICNYMQN